MNLFQAILIGNFEEASLIMRDTRFLQSIQNVTEEPNGGDLAGNNKVLDSEHADVQRAFNKKVQ